MAQGDMRPMAKNPEAMADLQRILAEREHLYRQADLTVRTSGHSVAQIAGQIAEATATTGHRHP
jgi:XRE family aerobic/anaerobic benzoate catabolism transcriptional regulator